MKIKNKLFIIMILFIILLAISTKVQAASASVSSSSTNVKPGTKVTITTKINGASWQVKLSGAVNEVYSDSTSDAEDTTKYEKTTFTPSKEGTYKITLSGNVTGSADTKSTQVSDSVTIVAKDNDSNSNNNTSNNNSNNSSNSSKPSSNANLKNLGIKPHDFSGFKSSITTYSATVPNDTEKVTIYATASDSEAKITGTGSKTLKEGKNTFYVKVTAEDNKTTKTYTLNITRNSKDEDKSTDATLKELEIRPKEYDFSGFKANKYDYSATVDNDVEKINIYASATNSKSTITGDGEKELKVGENKFEIVVTAEDKKTTKTYNLTITRKDEDNSNKNAKGIKNIKVGNYQLTPAFDPQKFEYEVQIKEIIDKLDVKVETDDENLETEIVGNNNLKKGDNIITILVNDKKENTTTTYQIIAKVGNDQIDLSQFNNEVKNSQANLKRTEYIIKGTVLLIVILIIVFLIQRYRLGKQDEDYETDSYNIEEPEEVEEKEEKKKTKHKGKRFK